MLASRGLSRSASIPAKTGLEPKGGIMANEVHRRSIMGGTIASATLLHGRAFAQTAATSDKLIPWTDQPPPIPPAAVAIKTLAPWEDPDSVDHAE